MWCLHIHDFLASQLSQVYRDVKVEPLLQPGRPQPLEGDMFTRQGSLTGRKSRPDIRGDFTGMAETPTLISNSNLYQSIPTKNSTNVQNRQSGVSTLHNEQTLNGKLMSFCPLVFPVTGGSGLEANTFTKILCSRIATKFSKDYSCVMVT